MQTYISDEYGEPLAFRAKGMDITNPEGMMNVCLEVRPGGNVVAVPLKYPASISLPSSPPEVITVAEAEDARKERAEETNATEAAAVTAEREARATAAASRVKKPVEAA